MGELDVFAESRRNMFYSMKGDGTTRCVAFTVNVRDPEGQPIQDADRGQPGLNLRIAKGSQALEALTVKPAGNPVIMYIAGDSTVADQDPQLNLPAQSRFTGWGQQGQSATQAYFVGNDRTHSNELGAKVFAEMIVREIQRQNIPLRSHLR